MKTPEIYADYHDVDDDNRVFLTKVGTRRDLAEHGLKLSNGLHITIYMDDANDEGPDDLMADAIVRYNTKAKCWVAQIDWSKVMNRSEREKAAARKAKLGSKNGVATPTVKKPKAAKSKPRKTASKTHAPRRIS